MSQCSFNMHYFKSPGHNTNLHHTATFSEWSGKRLREHLTNNNYSEADLTIESDDETFSEKWLMKTWLPWVYIFVVSPPLSLRVKATEVHLSFLNNRTILEMAMIPSKENIIKRTMRAWNSAIEFTAWVIQNFVMFWVCESLLQRLKAVQNPGES